MLDPSIAEHLTTDDDPELWELATSILLTTAAAKAATTRDEVYAQIGCCHHWISSHRGIHWTADGGFAWPFGYNPTVTGPAYRALPAFTWSVPLKWTGDAWQPGRTGRRCLIFRVSIPGRTTRHLQAAVHTIWTPRSPAGKQKALQLFGFRKREGGWRLTAVQPKERVMVAAGRR